MLAGWYVSDKERASIELCFVSLVRHLGLGQKTRQQVQVVSHLYLMFVRRETNKGVV